MADLSTRPFSLRVVAMLLSALLVLGLTSVQMVFSGSQNARANGGPTIAVAATSLLVNQTTNLGITLSGFSTAQQQDSYQVTLKYVDQNGVEQNKGVLAASQSGTSLVTGYNSYSGAKLGFRGTYSQIAAALSTVTWTPTQATSGLTLRIGLSTAPGTNQFYDANSGHYYEFVSAPQIRATDAFDQARARTLFGLNGYVVHITSRAENDFIANETSASNIWIGATDSAVEGQWRWAGAQISGESDFVFGTYNGTLSTPTATASGWGQNDWYSGTSRVAGWALNEPNDYQPAGEDYAVTNWSGVRGAWNDLGNEGSSQVSGYLVEYGGAGGTLTALTLTKDAVMGASDAQATWTAPSSPTVSSTQSFGLSFNYIVTGIASADFVNAGTATGCVFTPSAAAATASTSIQVVVSGCSTGTIQPRLLQNSVAVAGGLVLPTATATPVTITVSDLSASNTVASASATRVTAGSTSPISFTVRPFDVANRQFGAGKTVQVSSTLGTVSEVTDNNDGTYSFTFLPGLTTGTAQFSVTIGSTTIQLPNEVSVVAAPSPAPTSGQQSPAGTPPVIVRPASPTVTAPRPQQSATPTPEPSAQPGVVLNTTDPTRPITREDGTLPEAVPGKVMVVVNGITQLADAEVIDDRSVRLETADGLEFLVTAVSTTGEPIPLSDDGSLMLTFGERIDVEVSGFKPQSELSVWLFSEPKQLGTIPVDASGNAAADLALGVELPPGKHSLQVTGVHPDGSPRSLMVSVLVTEDADASVKAESAASDVAEAAPAAFSLGIFALVVLVALLVVFALRRRSATSR